MPRKPKTELDIALLTRSGFSADEIKAMVNIHAAAVAFNQCVRSQGIRETPLHQEKGAARRPLGGLRDGTTLSVRPSTGSNGYILSAVRPGG